MKKQMQEAHTQSTDSCLDSSMQMHILHSKFIRKVVYIFLAVFGVFITVLSVSHFYTVQYLSEQTKHHYDDAITLIGNQINSEIENLRTISVQLCNDPQIIAANEAEDSPRLLWEYLDILQRSNDRSASVNIPNIVNVYLPQKNRVLSSTGRFSEIDQDTFKQLFHDDLRWNVWSIRSIHNAPLCLGCSDPNHFQEYLSFIYKKDPSVESAVCIEANIAVTDLKKHINSIKVEGDGAIFLINSDGMVIASDLIPKLDFKELRQQILDSGAYQSQISVDVGDDKYCVLFQRDYGTDILVGALYSESKVYAPINQIRFMLMFVVVFIAIGMLLLILISYRNLLRPLQSLFYGMQEVKNGNFGARIEYQSNNEMGFVCEQFNNMTEKMDYLINQVYLQDIRNKKSELKFLQSQINPHFLFNCLNFIYQMSMAHKDDLVASMSLYLAKYLRFSISTKQDTITLREELQNIQVYADIYKMQYPHQLDYYVDIPEKWMELKIPKLCIQPLVENAFVHGHKNTLSHGKIWITSEEQEEIVEFCVWNDHSEITEEELEKVHNCLNEKDFSRSYGLNNTNLRLKLYFGERSGVQFNNIPDQKITKVRIRIPIDHTNLRKEMDHNVSSSDRG